MSDPRKPVAQAQVTGHHAPARFETEDASPASIVKFAIGLLAFTVFVAVGMLLFLPIDAARHAGGDRHSPAIVSGGRPPLTTRWNGPETPDGGITLQTQPGAELATVRAAEDKALNHSGWVDQQARVVHIPIERAMELYVERGGNGGPQGPASGAAAAGPAAVAMQAAAASDAAGAHASPAPQASPAATEPPR